MFFNKKNDAPESVSFRPKQAIIGFYSSIKKSDLELYVRGRARDAMSISNCYYNILPYRDGFIWELHEGGSGKGFAKSVLALLDQQSSVVIGLDDRSLRIANKESGSFSCYLVAEDDDLPESEGVEFADKMKPMVTTGYAFYSFSKWCLFASIFALFLSFTFKYVIYDKEEDIVIRSNDVKLPISKIQEIKNVMSDPESYVTSVMFKGGKWAIQKEKEVKPVEIKAKSTEDDAVADVKELMEGNSATNGSSSNSQIKDKMGLNPGNDAIKKHIEELRKKRHNLNMQKKAAIKHRDGAVGAELISPEKDMRPGSPISQDVLKSQGIKQASDTQATLKGE